MTGIIILSACGQYTRSSDVMARVVTDISDLPVSRLIFYSDASPDTDEYLDEEEYDIAE